MVVNGLVKSKRGGGVNIARAEDVIFYTPTSDYQMS